MKECGELLVMSQFLENQMFMESHPELVGSSSFTEGYLTESVDSVTIEAIQESFAEKAKNIWSNIKKQFNKVLGAFIRFCKRVAPIFTKDCRRAEAIAHRLSSHKFTEPEIKEIVDTVSAARSKSEFVVGVHQPIKSIKFNAKSASVQNNNVKQMLAAALTTKYAFADANKTVSGNEIGALPLSDIDRICLMIGKKDVTNIPNAIENAWTNAKRDDIRISVRGDDIEEVTNKLQTALDSIMKLSEKNEEDASSVEDRPGPSNVSRYYEDMRNILTKMVSATSNTMKIYTSYNSFRGNTLTALEKILSKAKDDGAAEEPKKED